jgi:hypothetical protein
MAASALVVAILGTTSVGQALSSALPRNSVGSLQLKRNAVGPQKLAPNAVRSGHVLDGSLLVADFKAGQIPAGPKGDHGPPGVSGRQIVTLTSALDSSTTRTASVACPAGKVVLGGGGAIAGNQSGVALFTSRPSGNTAWVAAAHEVVPNPGNWSLIASAVCAKVT